METAPHLRSPETLLSHAGFVRNLTRGLLADPAAADDVAQETMVLALERPPRSLDSLRGWLAAVARSLARQNARGEGRRRAREAGAARAEFLPSAAEVAEREALRSSVVQAVLALREPSRTAVLLRYYEEKPPREIAALLGVPVETVRTRVKRGLAELRATLAGELGDERNDRRRALLVLAGAGAQGAAPGLFLPLAAAAGAVLLGVVGWQSGWFAPFGGARRAAGAEGALQAGLVAQGREPSPAQQGEQGKQERGTREPVRSEVLFEGTVTDARGQALPGAVVFVSKDGPPPAKFSHSPRWLAMLRDTGVDFALLTADAAGRFRAPRSDATRVYVAVIDAEGPYFKPDAQAGVWVVPPASAIALTVPDAPTAELCATARLADGTPLSEFTCAFRRVFDGHLFARTAASGGRACAKLPLLGRGQDEFELALEGRTLANPATRLRLAPGERRELELRVAQPVPLEGLVVDPTGAPVADALVFSGARMRLAGERAFEPLSPELVRDGVRTDAAGRFTLPATERNVTVSHPAWSTTTVTRDAAACIRLEPRATICGRLLQPDGRPLAGVELALDRKEATTTDALGRFAFDGVEPGVRQLYLPRRRLVGVALRPGESAELELGAEPRVDATVELLRGGARVREAGGVLIGLDTPIEVREFKTADGHLTVEHALPGRYLLLGVGGEVATVRLDSAPTTAELGDVEVHVRAWPETRVYVVPAPSNELSEHMAERVAARRVPESGVVTWRLPPGRYAVGIEHRGVQAEVEVAADAGPAELTLE